MLCAKSGGDSQKGVVMLLRSGAHIVVSPVSLPRLAGMVPLSCAWSSTLQSEQTRAR